MVVKFFSDKRGGGIGSLNYLLDKKRVEQGTAKILSGDEYITRDLVMSMSQKHKTCVGCLSFEELDIDENTKKELRLICKAGKLSIHTFIRSITPVRTYGRTT